MVKVLSLNKPISHPYLKWGLSSEISNYRPILALDMIGKALETVHKHALIEEKKQQCCNNFTVGFCTRLFICASWSPAGKGLTSWLSFVVSSVSLSLSHWYPGSGVVLDCIDS